MASKPERGRLLNCLFCNGKKKNYKPEPDTDFICGSCIQLFLNANQEDLRRAYKKALDKGYINKARAIESFLIPEDRNGKQINKRRIEKHSNRNRINGTARFKKISNGSSKIRKTVTLFKN